MRWLALVLLLAGCSAPVLKIPIGQAALVYADARVAYRTLEIRVTDACKAGKLDKDTCAQLATEAEKAKMIDADVRKGIASAEGEIDWEKVMQYVQLIAGVALKAGGL